MKGNRRSVLHDSAGSASITGGGGHRSVSVLGECDHARLKARLRPMRGLNADGTASVVIRGHAFIQNVRRGHYELGVEVTPVFRLATAFGELQLVIRSIPPSPTIRQAL